MDAPTAEVSEDVITSWADLVGKAGEDARKEILRSAPHLKVAIVPHGSMVTMDFRTDRVRIFVDADGLVVVNPNLG
jgi:hypothetical protein